MLTRTSVRRLHTSRVSYGFMDWFKMKKSQENKPKPEDINSVIAKAESGELGTTKVEKIEFIGKKKATVDPRPVAERLNGFYIKHWITKDKVADAVQYEQLIVDEYNAATGQTVNQLGDVDLTDLETRFKVTKQLQAKSGRLIPDYLLTKASSGALLHAHFDKLVNGVQSANHLTVDQIQITSPNVYIQPAVTSRQRKSKFKQLLKEAKHAQEVKTDELIQGVRV